MPEATVDEDCHLRSRERDVDATAVADDLVIDAVPEPSSPELAAECEFRRSISTTLFLYPTSDRVG